MYSELMEGIYRSFSLLVYTYLRWMDKISLNNQSVGKEQFSSVQKQLVGIKIYVRQRTGINSLTLHHTRVLFFKKIIFM